MFAKVTKPHRLPKLPNESQW